MSNDTVKYGSTPTFNGPGWAVNSVNGCKAGNCDIGVPHNYNTLPATNPLHGLDTASFNTRTGNTDNQQRPQLPLPVQVVTLTPNSTGAYKK